MPENFVSISKVEHAAAHQFAVLYLYGWLKFMFPVIMLSTM